MKKSKRLIGIFVASIMATQVLLPSFVSAGTGTIPKVGVWQQNDSVEVDIDMKVRKSENGNSYTNGPVEISTDSKKGKADFEAILETKYVWDAIKKWHNFATTAHPDEQEELDHMKVSGEFTVTIKFPKEITAPDDFKNGTDMYGFDEKAKNIFEETEARTYAKDAVTGEQTVTIKYKVAEPKKASYTGDDDYDGNTRCSYILGEDLWGDRASKDLLPDTIALQAIGADVEGEYNENYTVYGTFEGNVKIDILPYTPNQHDNHYDVDVRFDGVQKPNDSSIRYQNTVANHTQDISATVRLTKPSGTGGGGGSVIPIANQFIVDFILEDIFEGATPSDEVQIIQKIIDKLTILRQDTITLSQILEIEQEVFQEGFNIKYIDMDTEEVYSTEELVEYLNKVKDETKEKEKRIKVSLTRRTPASMLAADVHYMYIVGYPDGTVRPERNIPRDEVATIFFRLMTDEMRDIFYTAINTFSDVDIMRWSNKAISTMEAVGAVTGYPDGTFKPNNKITRAEFATIVARLDDSINLDAKQKFTDVSESHWANKYIAGATERGWLAGDPDGRFRPDDLITRAEAMSIVNRMLNRYVNADGLHKDAKLWPDNSLSKWYYYDVEEATNSHNFVRGDHETYETWTEMIPDRDWLAIEEADARKSLTYEQKMAGWVFPDEAY